MLCRYIMRGPMDWLWKKIITELSVQIYETLTLAPWRVTLSRLENASWLSEESWWFLKGPPVQEGPSKWRQNDQFETSGIITPNTQRDTSEDLNPQRQSSKNLKFHTKKSPYRLTQRKWKFAWKPQTSNERKIIFALCLLLPSVTFLHLWLQSEIKCNF